MKERRVTLSPIGTIQTPYTSRYEAPRQPGTSRRGVRGTITLLPGRNFEQATEDLEGFDYIWILFLFDRNDGWKPKVLPPASDRTKRGVFATRSPYRPNPLGLSLCRVVSVQGRTITVEDPDLLDGTPVLDIKPYIPRSEAKPRAKSGWIGTPSARKEKAFIVTIASDVRRILKTSGEQHAEQYLRETLSRDPYPHSYRRIKHTAEREYRIAVRRWRCVYEIRGKRVRVVKAWEVKDE